MFDVNEHRAMRLLVRRRAFVAFECMLLRSTKELRKEQTKHLWICLGKEEQLGPGTAMTSYLANSFERSFERMSSRLDGFEHQISAIRTSMARGQQPSQIRRVAGVEL